MTTQKPAHGSGDITELSDQQLDHASGGIGSQTGGAGAGKVTFNPFSITRKIDQASPVFFQSACSGKPF